MRDSFTLIYALSEVDEPKVYRRMVQRFFGRPRRFLAPLLALIVAVVGGLFAHNVLQIDLVTTSALGGAYLVLVALLTAGITGRVQMRGFTRAALAAPWRQWQNTVTVTVDGINRTGALLPGDIFIDHFEMEGLSVVLLSPKEAVLLPHAALRDGAEGADLAAAIAHWIKPART